MRNGDSHSQSKALQAALRVNQIADRVEGAWKTGAVLISVAPPSAGRPNAVVSGYAILPDLACDSIDAIARSCSMCSTRTLLSIGTYSEIVSMFT